VKPPIIACVCCEREFTKQLAFFSHFRRKGKCQLTHAQYLCLVYGTF
jgi:hypothetical protein